MGRVIAAFTQFFDGDGDPLADGWLRFLEPGSNDTDKNTYNDSSYQVPNSNPLQLDGEGRCPSVFGTGSYRVISYHWDPDDEANPGEQIQLFDPVEVAETAASGAGTTFDAWSATVTYDIGDLVTYSSEYYRSLTAVNLNKNPALNAADWEKVTFVVHWNANITYEAGDMVYYDGDMYSSIQSPNLNQNPATVPAYWRRLQTNLYGTVTKTADYTVVADDRDLVVVLGAAAAAGRTMTLPTVTSADDGFRVGFYNASSYDMTIDPAGSATVWIDSSGSLVLDKGALIELRYDGALDVWAPIGNSGPALGGQDLATTNTPMLAAFINSLTINTGMTAPAATITTLTATTVNATTIPTVSATTLTVSGATTLAAVNATSLAATGALSGASLLVTGVCQAGSFTTAGAITGLSLNLDSGAGVATLGTLNFGTQLEMVWSAGDTRFEFNLTSGTYRFDKAVAIAAGLTLSGALLPSAANTYDIGSATAEIAEAYIGTKIYLGTSQSGELYHDGNMHIVALAGTLYLASDTAIGSVTLQSGTTPTDRWSVNASGHFVPAAASTYNIGGTSNEVQNIYIGTGALYLGAGQEISLSYNGTTAIELAGSAGDNIILNAGSGAGISFQVNSVSAWGITLGGVLTPALDNTLDLGQAGLTIKDIYSKGVYDSSITGRDVYVSSTGQIGYLSSARRFKTNIFDIDDTSWIYDLKAVEFDRVDSGEHEVGFIAEDVDYVNEHYAFSDEDGKLCGVHYRQIFVALVNEVQRLAGRLALLEGGGND